MARVFASALALLMFAIASPAAAQSDHYPSRPVKLVVMSAAGGGADALARILADRMEKRLGQQIIVENKPGAGGRLAAALVANMPADGYTFMLGGMTTHILAPGAVKNLPYDPIKSFTQLGRIGNSPILIVAAKDYPANNLAELAALSKKEPLQYASWGYGSTGHFCMEIFLQAKTLKIDHIPYASAAKIVQDIIGGHIRLATVDMATGTPFVKEGAVKPLAVCAKRSPGLPDVPSYSEQGIDFDENTSWSMHAPANLPPAIRQKLEDALAEALKDEDVRQKLLLLGITVDYQPGAKFTEEMKQSIPAWAEIARKANIKID